ncbi:hypothetical protein OUZ56_007804 [Daphnia magna]|uniref:Uncharacterized protein n=1 Tax=Daphnia magna TaxID=35525 RepID=A0ABR0ABG3_9CRUS|nr:hypothetical protein OUZ56_007804 [Daphnia magna]
MNCSIYSPRLSAKEEGPCQIQHGAGASTTVSAVDNITGIMSKLFRQAKVRASLKKDCWAKASVLQSRESVCDQKQRGPTKQSHYAEGILCKRRGVHEKGIPLGI